MSAESAITSTSGTALYYPYIHIRDADHLKAALLYWDRIRRIVPPNLEYNAGAVDGDDDMEVQRATAEGFLISTSPVEYQEAARVRFLSDCVVPVTADKSRHDLFRVDLIHTADIPNRSKVHVEKLGYELVMELQNQNLARQDGEWVTIRDEVAAFYMYCLACEMSRRIEAPLFTDSPSDAMVGKAMMFQQPANTKTPLADWLMQLDIDLPGAQELRSTRMATILEFSNKRQDERRRFRKAIEGIIKHASAVTDPNAIADYINDQRQEIKNSSVNLNRTFAELGIQAVNSVAKLTTPAAAGWAIGALSAGPEMGAILSGVGICVGFLSCVAETSGKLRQAATSSPYHYLNSIRRELS
jgi:hypothetical protein